MEDGKEADSVQRQIIRRTQSIKMTNDVIKRHFVQCVTRSCEERMISLKTPNLFHALAKSSKAPFVRDDIKILTSQEWAVIEKDVRSENGRRGNEGAVSSVANQMKEKTGEMTTMIAAASQLRSRGNQGALDALILRTGIALEEAGGERGRRAQDNRRIGTRGCATEKCKNTIQHTDGLCGRCRDLVPKKLKAEFCIGVGGRECGGKIYRVNQCRKCYDHPEAKNMREEKKAAIPKCRIDGCGGNEVRSYRLCEKHYRKRNEDAKAKLKVATDGKFGN
jgi:hypothetical protein